MPLSWKVVIVARLILSLVLLEQECPRVDQSCQYLSWRRHSHHPYYIKMTVSRAPDRDPLVQWWNGPFKLLDFHWSISSHFDLRSHSQSSCKNAVWFTLFRRWSACKPAQQKTKTRWTIKVMIQPNSPAKTLRTLMFKTLSWVFL